jgi:hypothetical protein
MYFFSHLHGIIREIIIVSDPTATGKKTSEANGKES